MLPRIIDERDTHWEEKLLDIRVFIVLPAGEVGSYDFDGVRFEVAQQWAQEESAKDGSRYSLALRQRSPEGSPGLLWIIDFANLS
jgi:hypothetical protein